MDRIKRIKETLIGWMEEEVGKGKTCFDCDAAGEVTDMIKDLAETEEKCIKAAYYCTLMETMKESGSEGEYDRYGYDNWRYASGRFAPKGSGHFAGYIPQMYEYEGEPMRMGYSGSGRGGNSGSGRGGNRGSSSGSRGGRSGGSNSSGSSSGSSSSGGSYGYWPMEEYYDGWSERGLTYDDYQNEKRHYHETKKPEDKEKMNESLGKNLAEVISQLREMSNDANPEMKKKLTSEISSVLEDVNQMM